MGLRCGGTGFLTIQSELACSWLAAKRRSLYLENFFGTAGGCCNGPGQANPRAIAFLPLATPSGSTREKKGRLLWLFPLLNISGGRTSITNNGTSAMIA